MAPLVGHQPGLQLGGRTAIAPRPGTATFNNHRVTAQRGTGAQSCTPISMLRGRSRGALLPQASARTARVWGTPVQPAPRKSAMQGPYIHGAVTRRGGRIIISAVLAGVEGSTDVRSMLDAEIKRDVRLVTGQLENGLRYVIYPNKLPPKRFEAHLEVHAGSVDELPNEQGIAHLVEHVTFLGSQRRENLLGSGARANAYTDFHHTVFHVHSPITNSNTKAPMLPQVLEALQEIAFNPQFLPLRIEKERKAVMAEAQMMNTIEYRVDCQLLQYLHHENNLGYRFPIGKMDQVQKWPQSQLRDFWSKWYFPANATLYVVGDLDRDIEATRTLIGQVFGNLPPASTTAQQVKHLAALSKAASDGHQPPAYVALPAGSRTPGSAAASTAAAVAAAADLDIAQTDGNGNGNGVTLLKQRHAVRPPVVHTLGYGPLEPGFEPAPVNVFRHPLLQHYMLSVFCKLPIVGMSRMEHLKRMFLVRVLLSTFQFRINKRYVAADPPFMGISLDISDSGREGCMVSTLTITSEPAHWAGATRVAVEEVRRLQRYGLTAGELERYTAAITRDSAQLAEQGNKIPSLDTLNFVMESLACGHTVMEHREAHEAMVQVSQQVTLEDANALARSMLTFASDYGHEAAALADADAQPSHYTFLGPTRTTSILACIPAYVSATGDALTISSAAAASRSANLGAAGHIDVDSVDLKAIEEEARLLALEEESVPEGAIRFDIPTADVQAVLSDMSYEVEAPVDVACPKHLFPPDSAAAKVGSLQPRYVPLDGEGSGGNPFPPPDPHSGIVQRRLSNGMRLNYRHTDNEPQGALLRIIAPGGQAAQKLHVGPDGFGAVVLGPSTLNEVGTVGSWKRDEVEVFCITNLVNIMTDCDEENNLMDMHFAVGHGSMEAAFELLHMFLEEPVWDAEALKRAKTHYVNNKGTMSKSLEKATAERIMQMMMGGPSTRQFRDPTEEELDALTLEGVRKTTMGLMHADAIEINIVGDIDGQVIEDLVLRYLGTVAPRQPEKVLPIEHVTQGFQTLPFEERHAAWHLQDSDERAVAYIAGPAPARWGPFGNYDPLPPLSGEVAPPPVPQLSYPNQLARQQAAEARRKHPLYTSCLLLLLTEIINSRLFTTVRDSLGLTYDVSFECTMLDRVRAGWFSVHVTSHPTKIFDALDASVAVLRDIEASPINRRELARARTTILTRHESDLKDNSYWLGLMTHLQNPHVPWKSVTCLRDLKAMYEAITVEDIYHAYTQLKLDDDSLYTCVGTSGKSAPEPPEERLVNGIGSSRMADQDWAAANQAGATGQAPVIMNPMAMFTAMLAAAQSLNLKKALDDTTPAQQQQQQAQPKE